MIFHPPSLSHFALQTTWPNKSPEPTAVGAVSSAVAVHVAGRRWLSFLRSAARRAPLNPSPHKQQQNAMTTKPTPRHQTAFNHLNTKACFMHPRTILMGFAIRYGIPLCLAIFNWTWQQAAVAQGLTPVDI